MSGKEDSENGEESQRRAGTQRDGLKNATVVSSGDCSVGVIVMT